MFGQVRSAGIADMVAIQLARGEKTVTSVRVLLHAKLVDLYALADFIITDRHHALAADMVRVGGNGVLLRVTPGGGLAVWWCNDRGNQ